MASKCLVVGITIISLALGDSSSDSGSSDDPEFATCETRDACIDTSNGAYVSVGPHINTKFCELVNFAEAAIYTNTVFGECDDDTFDAIADELSQPWFKIPSRYITGIQQLFVLGHKV